MAFLETEVILHSDNTVETDIYYKDANTHDYLPYNLAKYTVVFVSNDEKFEMRLKELKKMVKGL